MHKAKMKPRYSREKNKLYNYYICNYVLIYVHMSKYIHIYI